jgi:signal transduction histidine kinase
VRSVPLRNRLFLLAAAGVLPLALLSGIGLYVLYRQQVAQVERTGVEVARALATAVDAELRRSFAALDVLASATSLDRDDVKTFDDRARRTLDRQPQWAAIMLSDADGNTLTHTGYPPGTELPRLVETESFRKALATRQPTVGYLAFGPRGQALVPLRLPIVRQNDVRYVITATLKPDAILDIVQRQRLSDEWLVSVFDAKHHRVARSRAHQEFLGGEPAPSLLRMMQSGRDEAAGVGTILEGDRVYQAYARLRDSLWTVAIAMPFSMAVAGAWKANLAYAFAVLISIVAGMLAAIVIARSVNRPMRALRDWARERTDGARAPLAETHIREIQEVAVALAAAARERDEAARERENLLVREQEARAAAESANRAKDEFLAMLGHELRNPLGAIANAAHLLEDPRTEPQGAARARAIIGRQVAHLGRLTDDLLDVGRALTGKIVLQRRVVDLAAATAQAVAILRTAGRLDHHALVERLEPAWIDADPVRLDQVIANLLVNAIKYTPHGKTISVSVERIGAEAVLRVADEGIGMSPELAARAFELFVQGKRALDRAGGGLGIGLTLVKRLVELHGGMVTAYSAGPDEGSEFVVRLPAVERLAPAERTRAPSGESVPREILVIEDHEDARDSLASLLEGMGHRVQVAPDGASGLDKALAMSPDVALVDVGLPELDGYEVARRIRGAARGGRRPYLVALTGYGLAEDRARAFEAGFDAHLVKPVDPVTLATIIEKSAL